MLVLDVDHRVEFIDITGPDGSAYRLMRGDLPHKPGQIWPLVVGGERIGTMIGLPKQRVGFQDVPRRWQIVRSNANVRVPKGVVAS